MDHIRENNVPAIGLHQRLSEHRRAPARARHTGRDRAPALWLENPVTKTAGCIY